MTEIELQDYADRCAAELDRKQDLLRKTYGLGGFDEYVLDLEKGMLHFDKAGERACRFSTVLIGSLAPVSKNWLWGWANESLSGTIRERASRLKALYDKTGFDIFRAGTFKADGNLARELSALAVDFLGAAGIYRVPGGDDQGQNIQIYLALFPAE